MKNIHILPTEKPSRFVKSKENKKCYLYSIEEFNDIDKFIEYDSKRWDSQNIYITSDEEIKEGDWIYDASEMSVIKCPQMIKPFYFTQFCKKIILTTDQDLIKDDVQAIDDEFLEWFVQNPICEEVEVDWVDFSQSYFIKIPKEEPCEYFTPTIGCIKDICSCNKDPKQAPFRHECRVLSTEEVLANRIDAYEFIDFDKQETLEEVAKECLRSNSLPIEGDFAEGYITGSLFGAKWQQEKMYSEEEVIQFVDSVLFNKITQFLKNPKEVLQQFKNK